MNRFDDELVNTVVKDDDWAPCWSALDFLRSAYVPARFGTVPVLVTAELADRIRKGKGGV